ncbi:amino acid adenylation domain-containing protein [Cytobacillus depressus]|uniref:Amino acid adenylation domain-containing protein n=1 Tax=Cytobacillus depressus TaxID=1602942 RepID=A0A6L3V1Z2_9BACI|nr:amino acid adenylation domain-containing protein [Cytobacillus depressus]KAB2332154.1 amino acid adenylation domain-containing protein [Cytobacillus depressus]
MIKPLLSVKTMKNTDLTIIDKFHEMVSIFPKYPAISMNNESLTYDDLNKMSNEVAFKLINQGVRKGDFVGVFLNRSMEAIISLLGIMKSGGVYVPIDPSYPDERISYMVNDTACELVITNSILQGKLDEVGFSRNIYLVDKIGFDDRNIECQELTSADLAYVIYTSGSTGNPKGALIKHQGVLNLAAWLSDHYQFDNDTVISEFASLSFDASIIDIFQALLNGVRLHILSEESRKDPNQLAKEIADQKITNMILPTAYFHHMTSILNEHDLQKLASLKVVALAGEALTGEMVRLWQGKFGYAIQISNFYGPTETTVMASFYDIAGEWPEEMANVPIGKPIRGFDFYIVNEKGMDCKTNEPGELLIEGPGLSVGYLNQPEKTAEAFIDHPTKKNTKLYRTGDIVRLLEDGNVEFIGRDDQQVKIRGHRVEIGEIEDKMLKLPFLKEAVVIPRQVKGHEKELFAFYTGKSSEKIEKNKIHHELKSALPDYMIPSYFIQLDEMPIAPTGKIDRKHLEKVDFKEVLSANIIEPRNEVEMIISQALCDELHVDKLDIKEDLFTNGLNSLKVLNVLVKLKPHFPEISIQDFFQCRSIEKLAEHIASLESEEWDEGQLIEKNLIEHPLYTKPLKGYTYKMKPELTAILLTGATGFLGSHILYDLLENTKAHIHCLTRASSTEEAKNRLEEILKYYFVEIPETWLSRIVPVLGDLSQEAMGLTSAARTYLETNLDMIIHCAADVRHFGEQSHFNKVNIGGTASLLNLVKNNKGAKFIYISTIGIPDDLAHSNLWGEFIGTNLTSFSYTLTNVYTSSKLEAEKLVYQAMEEGTLATVCRMGNITGHSVTGKFQRNIETNAFYRMLKAVMTLGEIPEYTAIIDVTPVDIASKTVVELAMKEDAIGRTFHIVDPEPTPFVQFINYLKELGYAIELVDKASFSKLLLPEKGLDSETLQLAVSILEGEGVKDSLYRWDCSQTEMFSTQKPLDKEIYLSLLVQHGEEVEYFPALQKRDLVLV